MKILTLNSDGLEEIVIDEEVKKPSILIGCQRDAFALNQELELVKKALSPYGFEIIESSHPWPRDLFVYNDETYFFWTDFGKIGKGGNVVHGKDFVLISKDAIGGHEKELLEQYSNDLFPGLEIYVIPSYSYHEKSDGHIDLTIGSVKSKNLLTIDKKHYEIAKDIFDDIEKKHKTTIIPIESESKDGCIFFEHNYLVIEEGMDQPIAVVNRIGRKIRDELLYNGLIVLSPNQNIVCNPSVKEGGIRCMTNLVYSNKILNFLRTNNVERLYN
jgi:hypothetical protein